MSSKILNGFTLSSETKQAQHIDKSAVRREKVVLNLAEQGDIARAMLSGTDYLSCRVVIEKDANGNEVEVEKVKKVKKVRRWFYNNGGEEWYLEIRYANKALELAKGKTAIVIPTKDKIVSTIELAIQAVEEKELDSSIAKIAEEKKKGFSKAV